jgi:rod shape-determining protein MreC
VIGVRDTRRTRVVLVVLVAVALALIAFDYRDGSSSFMRDLKNTGGSVFGAAEHGASSIGRFFDGSGSGSSQNTALQREVVQLRAELNQARLSKAEYKQLRKLLLVAGAGQYRVVAATVIAVGQGFQQTVTLDTGSANGVRVNDTVLNGQGLVGEVTSVTSSTATVRLAQDSSSVVGVQVAPSGQEGVVTGPGNAAADGLMKLQMLNSAAVIKPGEALVTAASNPYVPGVPVGVIARLENRGGSPTALALVRPYVDFGSLGVVGVVINRPGRNPRFSVLPPLPRPAPTVTVTVTAPPSKPGTHSSPTPSTGG